MARSFTGHGAWLRGRILCILLCGCGFCDQPIETGHRWDDGTAPWREQAPIEVCSEGARFVPPDDLPEDTGVCRAAGSEAPTCTSSSACGPRESCICGLCTIQLCSASSQCAPGTACVGMPRRCSVRCEDDADCPSPMTCASQACVAPCGGDGDCASGERCLAGRCGVLPCAPGGPTCDFGETCAEQSSPGALAAPAVIADGGRTVLYTELTYATGATAILRAESRDGLHFTTVPVTPVLSSALGPVSAPSVLRHDDGSIDLYVAVDGGGYVARARSPDGITFETPERVLDPILTWEDARVASPHVIEIAPGDVLLFYEGGMGEGIGVARSRDGAPFERIVLETPYLERSEASRSERWSPLGEIGGPGVIEVETPLGDRELRLFFEGVGVEAAAGNAPDGGPAPANASIGLATIPIRGQEPDLSPVLWPYNPVLFRIQSFVSLTEREPVVIYAENQWRMYFDDGAGVVHLATPSLR